MAKRKRVVHPVIGEQDMEIPVVDSHIKLGATLAEMAVGACAIISSEMRMEETLDRYLLDREDLQVVDVIRCSLLLGLQDLLEKGGHIPPFSLEGTITFTLQFNKDGVVEQWIGTEFDVVTTALVDQHRLEQ